jgi:hypothetical protein
MLLQYVVLNYAVLQLPYNNVKLSRGTLVYLPSVTSHFSSACLPYTWANSRKIGKVANTTLFATMQNCKSEE